MNNRFCKRLVFLIVMVLCIVGCGESTNGEPNISRTVENQEYENTGKTASESHNKETESESESAVDNKALVEKYLESVKYIYDNKVDLFGNEIESHGQNEDNNRFAIEDIDHDGVLELILSWTDCSKARMWGGIYQFDYENAQYIDEGIHDDDIIFYENELAITKVSHNDSKGEMWPYSLYMYNPEQDKYEFVFYAYSWEKRRNEEDFPDDVDTDNAGIVYYVDDAIDSKEEVNPLSQTQYNDIYNRYFSEAEELIPVYYPLSDIGIEEYQEVLEVLEYERTY